MYLGLVTKPACSYAGTIVLVTALLAITEKQKRFVWVLTHYQVLISVHDLHSQDPKARHHCRLCQQMQLCHHKCRLLLVHNTAADNHVLELPY